MTERGDFLATMARRSRERVHEAQARESEARLRSRAMATDMPPALTLHTFDVIAELKLRSPAMGELSGAGFDKSDQILAYANGGACAVSVLTEPDAFHGSLDDLRDAAGILRPFGVPAMRKDFLTDPYQLLEARAAGAGGALLIVTMLEDALVRDMLACASELGLFVLLEGFDTDDLRRIEELTAAPSSTPVLAGVNCRNLRTLQVEFDRFTPLAQAMPAHLPGVAESGVGGVDDIRTIAALGYRLALVGSALMTNGTPRATLESFIAAGRSA